MIIITISYHYYEFAIRYIQQNTTIRSLTDC